MASTTTNKKLRMNNKKHNDIEMDTGIQRQKGAGAYLVQRIVQAVSPPSSAQLPKRVPGGAAAFLFTKSHMAKQSIAVLSQMLEN